VKDISFSDVNADESLVLLRLIEAYGTGLMKIRVIYTKSNVKPWILVADNPSRAYCQILTAVRVQELYIVGVKKSRRSHRSPDKRESAVLRMLNEAEYVVLNDVQDTLEVSWATAILFSRK